MYQLSRKACLGQLLGCDKVVYPSRQCTASWVQSSMILSILLVTVWDLSLLFVSKLRRGISVAAPLAFHSNLMLIITVMLKMVSVFLRTVYPWYPEKILPMKAWVYGIIFIITWYNIGPYWTVMRQLETSRCFEFSRSTCGSWKIGGPLKSSGLTLTYCSSPFNW